MQKKKNTFSDIIVTNKKTIKIIYQKYIFLIIISLIIFLSVFFFFKGAHVVMFGRTDTAIGQYIMAVATILGGTLVALGLWVNNRRVSEQIRQNDIAEKAQINMRFKDAATLLGSENVSSTLSGVYALHQIAIESHVGDDTQKGYVNIIHDILCAFIRENTDTVKNEENGKSWRINKKPAIIIETILKVLFKNEKQIYRHLITDLSYCVFEHIYLEDANIIGVDFSKTKFIKSRFKGSVFHSCFMEETFIDEVDFSMCVFEKAIFDNSFIRKTSFEKSKFIQSDFCNSVQTEVKYNKATFVEVDFNGASLDNLIDFEGATFDKTTLP